MGNILGVWLPLPTSLAQWWNTNKHESTELCLLQEVILTVSVSTALSSHLGTQTNQQDTEGRQWAGKTSQLQASSSIHSYTYILSTQPKHEIPLNKQVD